MLKIDVVKKMTADSKARKESADAFAKKRVLEQTKKDLVAKIEKLILNAAKAGNTEVRVRVDPHEESVIESVIETFKEFNATKSNQEGDDNWTLSFSWTESS